ncbi:UDP-N-acetylmuramoyl-tripeptide--D-alanyl-D-alanine ligase [Desulfosarcina cetonica]|uniref:UDP-N-acetylmuramoyl-tripeptide--D-alanyl-D- alanine ligase n=1 Tax=Desulfosarcina cetonica TaxID=90730 RepID=UPI0006D1DF68|nr:UDP-N-acetylmuramoyl-tripeptide--D-alanyl-D-alanine ligase [Desulfosarcina cetonica]VTR66392.1 UDP-N-acetylmuramoyl-tripeptide--D-alanyl-D-alanine ligase [Desulfosarcina cetonica]
MSPYRWTIEKVMTATDGRLVCGSAQLDLAGIAIDSRTVLPDQLFVAIAGESHDGHRFIAQVLDSGVKGVVVADAQVSNLPLERMRTEGVACVRVPDTTRALGDLARFNRRRGGVKVVAVTGSNGKTSTRMLMELVIGQTFVVLATSGNMNNHIGLPLTLFRLGPAHHAAVLELGMNHAGEIDTLGRICEPDVGVITNVGPAHLEGLGSIDNVARAKGELLGTIRAGGTAVLNGDDPRVAALGQPLDCPVVYFGTGPDAQVRAESIRLTAMGMTFVLVTPSGSVPVRLATPSRVMVGNALAAAAAGEILGVSLDRIQRGLERFEPQVGRMGIRRLGHDIRLIDDTYNANPASMLAAIETLAALRGESRTIAVLGDMLELGEASSALHHKVGERVGQLDIDRLFVTGTFADSVAAGALGRRMPASGIFSGSQAEITAELCRQLAPGDLVLVKGSRGMAMERVVEAVCRWAQDER